MATIQSEYPVSPEIDDVLRSENAPSNENLKKDEFHDEKISDEKNSEAENFENSENSNFDSVNLENHPEIRKYLDSKYPDDPNEPKKKLIIISAMFRSGSSFMGSLFGPGSNQKTLTILVVLLLRSHERVGYDRDHDRVLTIVNWFGSRKRQKSRPYLLF